MRKKYDLFCYAGAGKNDKMYLGNDKDTDGYIKEYGLFLNILWDYIDDRRKWGGNSRRGPYEDPDRLAGNKRVNPKFYSELCAFLNARAEDEKGKKYEFKDNFIKCDDINLVSDQFGFSAPSLMLNHPYDIYLEKCKAEGKDPEGPIDNVINWVMTSRTIGGSFLWPKGIWGGKSGRCGYNVVRGTRSYIEDRVDLTLCEIKHYLDAKNYENDILYTYIKENPVEKEWIKSFGKSERSKESSRFEGYVDYFCFNPFVDENYMPYDIVKSNIVEGVKKPIKENKDRKKNSIFNLNSDELEKMFNNVNTMIIQRSSIMEEIIAKNERQTQSSKSKQ